MKIIMQLLVVKYRIISIQFVVDFDVSKHWMIQNKKKNTYMSTMRWYILYIKTFILIINSAE